MGFSDELRAGSADLWEAQHAHPFVRGVADGSLDPAVFEHYVRQDHVFLVEYARLLALGAARAPDLTTMRRFADLTQAILGEEMELHRGFASRLGIDPGTLEAQRPAPTTRAYTDFLVRTAALGDFAELCAALLPCMWGYAEIGARLAAEADPGSRRPEHVEWIATYADPGFQGLATWCRELVDGLAEELPEAGRARMHAAFRACSRLELDFWEMAWTRQQPDGTG